MGDADLDRFRAALTTIGDAPEVDALIVIACPTAVFDHEELATLIGDFHEIHDVPIVGCLMGGATAERAGERLDRYGIPNFFDPARAVDALDALVRYGRGRDRVRETPTRPDGIDRDCADRILSEARDAGRTQLGAESMSLLTAYGIDTPASRVVDTPAAAEAAARERGEPVVCKIVAPGVTHKTEVGGVRVGVAPENVASVAEELLARAAEETDEVLGVQIQQLVATENATETIVGGRRDPQFGPVALFGLGGIYVETLRDTTLRIGPVSDETAREMTNGIRAAPLLRGVRGQPGTDLGRVADAIRRLSFLVADLPLRDAEINPLVAGPDRVVALDFRATLADDESDGQG